MLVMIKRVKAGIQCESAGSEQRNLPFTCPHGPKKQPPDRKSHIVTFKIMATGYAVFAGLQCKHSNSPSDL